MPDKFQLTQNGMKILKAMMAINLFVLNIGKEYHVEIYPDFLYKIYNRKQKIGLSKNLNELSSFERGVNLLSY
jgi:hypothetical protein